MGFLMTARSWRMAQKKHTYEARPLSSMPILL
jgi:hypothetical protein